jgi:hypothetical protein
MWPTLVLTMRNNVGSREILWPTLIRVCSVVIHEFVHSNHRTKIATFRNYTKYVD